MRVGKAASHSWQRRNEHACGQNGGRETARGAENEEKPVGSGGRKREGLKGDEGRAYS